MSFAASCVTRVKSATSPADKTRWGFDRRGRPSPARGWVTRMARILAGTMSTIQASVADRRCAAVGTSLLAVLVMASAGCSRWVKHSRPVVVVERSEGVTSGHALPATTQTRPMVSAGASPPQRPPHERPANSPRQAGTLADPASPGRLSSTEKPKTLPTLKAPQVVVEKSPEAAEMPGVGSDPAWRPAPKRHVSSGEEGASKPPGQADLPPAAAKPGPLPRLPGPSMSVGELPSLPAAPLPPSPPPKGLWPTPLEPGHPGLSPLSLPRPVPVPPTLPPAISSTPPSTSPSAPPGNATAVAKASAPLARSMSEARPAKEKASPAKGQAAPALADKGKGGDKGAAFALAIAPAPREVVEPGTSVAEAKKPPAGVIAASASQPPRNEPAPAAQAKTAPAVHKPTPPDPPAGGNDRASATEADKRHRPAGKEKDQRAGPEGLSLAPASLVLVPLPEPAAVTFPSPLMPPPLIARPARPARFPLAALHPTALPERSEESLPNIPVPVANPLLPPVAARVDSPQATK